MHDKSQSGIRGESLEDQIRSLTEEMRQKQIKRKEHIEYSK
jgi:hypothetical protein